MRLKAVQHLENRTHHRGFYRQQHQRTAAFCNACCLSEALVERSVFEHAAHQKDVKGVVLKWHCEDVSLHHIYFPQAILRSSHGPELTSPDWYRTRYNARHLCDR